MSAAQTTALPPDAVSKALGAHLFHGNEDLQTYAVLDGASVPDLLDQLYGDDPPEFICLYRGDLAPDMAEVAPYLVHLKPESPFTEWLLSHCWGNHWGIFATAVGDLTAMRRHFRKFLMVRDPDGKQVYFRYYDPRVLRTFLPTCEAAETEVVGGPVLTYYCENETATSLLSFAVDGRAFRETPIKLES